MARHPDRRLIRYLHGELSAAEVGRLRAELARDPALQARLAELHRLWQGLQPPAPTPAPFGYVPRLQRLADERRVAAGASLLGWAAAPPAVRALAGAALVAGIALGIGVGRLPQPATPPVRASAPAAAQAAPPVGVNEPSPLPATAPTAAAVPSPAVQPLAPPEAPRSDGASAGSPAVEPSPLGDGGTLAEAYLEALSGDGADDGGTGGR
jgi:anti-sigma factor RsiW